MDEQETGKRIVEINSVKMEIDLRNAKVVNVDTLRIGDRVKVLIKTYSGYEVHAGTVIGFEPFQILPTIIVAYMTRSGGELKFLYFNAKSEDTEVVKATDNDTLTLDKAHVETRLRAKIDKARTELEDAERKLAYFLDNFAAYWGGNRVEAPAVFGADTDAPEEKPF